MPAKTHEYNYDHFEFEPYKRFFTGFQKRLPLGSQAPGFSGTDTEGRTVKLSDYRGKSHVVLEFGCITCAPAVTQAAIYKSSISKLLVPKFAGRGVEFLMVYTREAHPGERIGAHKSFQEKMLRARQFKRLDKVNIRIVVDGIDGKIHRKYGMLPNMIYIIGKDGRIVYKANWTDTKDVSSAIYNLLESEKDGPKTHMTVAVVEKYHFIRDHDIGMHRRVYSRGGKRALKEIKEQLGLPL